jgi:hypothetical protein
VAAVGDRSRSDASPGVADLYRALWADRRAVVARYHLDIAVVLGMVAAWVVIRTVFSDTGRLYVAWVALGAALILVTPRVGLILYIVTAAFFEDVTFSRALGLHDLLVVVLALSVGVRIVLDRGRTVPRSAALLLAGLLAVGTLAGVAHTVLRFDSDWAWHAAYTWVASIGGALIILVSAAWVARKGDLAPLITAVVVSVVVAVVALAEYVFPGLVSGGPLGWVGFWKDFAPRLAGIIPSPNGLAAQLVGPAALLLVALVFARDVRLRAAAAVALVPLVAALYLTYSRSPLVALVALVVIVAWRIRRVFGLVAIGVVLAASIMIVPSYLAFRGQAIGTGDAIPQPGQLLIATDQYRLQAWGAAVRMWEDAPVMGQGFLSYKLLADTYGDPLLGSPHNEWLRLFAEEGTIVGLLALALIAVAMRELGRLPGWQGTAFLSALAAIVLAATFNNPFLFLQVSAVSYAILGTGLALAARSPKRAAAEETGEYTRGTT